MKTLEAQPLSSVDSAEQNDDSYGTKKWRRDFEEYAERSSK
jgi:hypothetical protein